MTIQIWVSYQNNTLPKLPEAAYYPIEPILYKIDSNIDSYISKLGFNEAIQGLNHFFIMLYNLCKKIFGRDKHYKPSAFLHYKLLLRTTPFILALILENFFHILLLCKSFTSFSFLASQFLLNKCLS